MPNDTVFLTGDGVVVEEDATAYVSRPRANFTVDRIEAECKVCKKKVSLDAVSGMKLKIGDVVYLDSTHPYFGRCPQCKRVGTQLVTKACTPMPTQNATGFWKMPTEEGDSLATKTDSSDTSKG